MILNKYGSIIKRKGLDGTLGGVEMSFPRSIP